MKKIVLNPQTLHSKSKDSIHNYKVVVILHYHAIYSLLCHRVTHTTLLENRCLKKWLITNRNVAHFAHYQESYCYHILIEKLYNISEKDWEKIFIFCGRRPQRLSSSLILIFAACFFSPLDSFDSHVCESVTLVFCKLCAKLLDPKSSIGYWRRVVGEKLVVFG